MPRQYDTSEPRRADLAKPYKYEYESSDTVLPGQSTPTPCSKLEHG